MRTSYNSRNLTTKFGDARLVRRFDEICSQLGSGLDQTIPQSCKTQSATKAMYRFFDNKQVDPSKMMSTHYDHFSPQLFNGPDPCFIQLSDTTEVDYTKKRGAKQLGPLNYPCRRGMKTHNSLIISAQGVPMGLLRQSYILRRDEDFGKSAERQALPFEDKESYRWHEHFVAGQSLCEQNPGLRGIYVADREADIMELYHARTCERMHLIVRSQHDRKLEDKSGNLYSHLSQQPVQGTYQVTTLHPLTKKERKVEVEVRFCSVDLKLHKALPQKRGLPGITLYAVEAKEVNPPPDIKQPVHWVLLTTLPVENLEQAMQIIYYYSLRWLIERFHYLLKSGGAEVEKLQLETPHRLKNAITAYSIVAVSALKLRYWAEKSPQTSISEVGISPLEYQVLYSYANQKVDAAIKFMPEQVPTIGDFCKVLGRIGGFLPSKRQPLPGLKILSRAVQKLNILVDAYLIFCQRTQ